MWLVTLLHWWKGVNLKVKHKVIWDSIPFAVIWTVWNTRNQLVFDNKGVLNLDGNYNAVTNGDMPTTLLKDGSSRKVVAPREAVINSNAIAQEAEDQSIVGDSLAINTQPIGNEEQVGVPVEQSLEQFEVNHSQGIVQNPEVQTALEYATNEEIVNNEQVKDKPNEGIVGTVRSWGCGQQKAKQLSRFESFKEAEATSKKLGVIHHESDEELVNRMVQFKIEEQKNKYQLSSKKKLKRSSVGGNLKLGSSDVKKRNVRKLVLDKKPEVLLIQESKLEAVDSFLVQRLWYDAEFEVAAVGAEACYDLKEYSMDDIKRCIQGIRKLKICQSGRRRWGLRIFDTAINSRPVVKVAVDDRDFLAKSKPCWVVLQMIGISFSYDIVISLSCCLWDAVEDWNSCSLILHPTVP
ncbi:hypothetical protein RHGRI_032032 [Rhododendron griersonianum]|uniref:Uncharacterized protein n=1 Tax=Rhododendron griersonianum TaxID=479676 RepID=A0AAV6IAQ5_9ERIC|nr:hypothetical protein RHGRI_032032 [Rhododendron griersonianum]